MQKYESFSYFQAFRRKNFAKISTCLAISEKAPFKPFPNGTGGKDRERSGFEPNFSSLFFAAVCRMNFSLNAGAKVSRFSVSASFPGSFFESFFEVFDNFFLTYR